MQLVTTISKSQIAGGDGKDSLIETGTLVDEKGNAVASFTRNGDGTFSFSVGGDEISSGTPGKGISLLSSTPIDLNIGTSDQVLYTVPSSRFAIPTNFVIHSVSGDPQTATFILRWSPVNRAITQEPVSCLDAGLIGSVNGIIVGNIYIPGISGSPLAGMYRGAAGQTLAFKLSTVEGSAMTAVIDVFGYLTNVAGVPQNNILIP